MKQPNEHDMLKNLNDAHNAWLKAAESLRLFSLASRYCQGWFKERGISVRYDEKDRAWKFEKPQSEEVKS